jgi:hypothetical protein
LDFCDSQLTPDFLEEHAMNDEWFYDLAEKIHTAIEAWFYYLVDKIKRLFGKVKF